MPDRLDAAAEVLYARPPDEFLARRGEFAATARADGDVAAAQAIEKLRKPTLAAWVVNAHVLAEPAAAAELTELGDRLRTAQDALDAGALRELSAERRAVVGRLTQAALDRAGRRPPSVALRDEVTGTFDAAIADPDVARRLGRLPRAERWSGFGFGPDAAPVLTLLRGGQGEAEDEPEVAEAERHDVERSAAQQDFQAADDAYGDAQAAEQELGQQLRRLTARLTRLQAELVEVRAALDEARKATTDARTRRHRARVALDRLGG